MKIAFLINKFPALSETFILSQITGLIDRGHDVDIYADGPREEAKIHPDVEKYRLLERICYYNLRYHRPKNKFRRVVKALRMAGQMFSNNPAAILRSLNVLKFGREALSLTVFYTVLPFVGKGPYDIVQCHYGRCGVLGVFLRDMGVITGKIVTMVHGYDVTAYVRSQNYRGYAELFKKGDLFIHASAHMRQVLLELGCDERKMVMHHVTVDTRQFEFTRRILRDGEEVNLLTVGRLVEKKGIEYSIRAVAKALRTYPTIRYRIAGDGILRPHLQALIDQLGVGDRIELLGWKSQEEIRQLYAEAHLFILASVTASDGDQEGQGLVLQEAQAMGLPVICTRHNGFPEGVLEGKSALLVSERDPEALAQQLEHLIRYPAKWPEMGQAGRAFVEAHYDHNLLTEQLINLYQRLLTTN
jgi:colanic acid/amylovoran biosynthesis glycosyltransferase